MAQRITIQIIKKIATCLTELPIVCGNSDYVVDFQFDEEWNGHSLKTARFKVNGEYTDVVFEGNVCEIPIISNAKVCWVGVFAGDLSTTTPAIVHCKPSILDGEDLPAPPRDDVYAQITELCEEAVSTAKDVENRANNGEFGRTPQKGIDYFTEDDVTSIVEESASEVLTELQPTLEEAKNAAREYTDNSVGEINKKIPNQASESNQLADKDFVNSSINSSTARYLTYSERGSIFHNKTSLIYATKFYYNGQETIPTKNDYVVVEIDESHNKAQTRYVYVGEDGQGQWVFQYKINDTPFTSEQNAAINSKITKELVDKIKNLVIDEILSTSSTNPVQNKVVAKALNSKADGVNGAAKNLTIAEDGGNAFIGKTIGDLKAGLAEWLTTNATVGAIRKIGGMRDLASLWNSGDDEVIALKQTTWTVTNLLYQHKGNYAQLSFSTYYSKDIYLVSYQNGVWSDMRKFAFDDEKLDKNIAEWEDDELQLHRDNAWDDYYYNNAVLGIGRVGFWFLDSGFNGFESHQYDDLVDAALIRNGGVPLYLPTKPGTLALEGKGLQFTTLAQAKPITLENSSAYLYSSSLSNAKIIGATLPEGSLLADTAFDTGFILLPKSPHTDGKYHGVAFIRYKQSLMSSTGICNFTYTDEDTVQIVTESGGGRLWSLSI